MEQDVTPAPPPPSDRKRLVLAATGGGLAVVLLGAAGFLASGWASADTGAQQPDRSTAAAADSQSSPTRDADPLAQLGLDATPLHGSVVVKKSDGTYQTVVAQRGSVTAVSADSLTVRSEDGYEQTYVLDDDTVVNGPDGSASDLATGADVAVLARDEGGAVTATHVIDLASLPDRLGDLQGRLGELQGRLGDLPQQLERQLRPYLGDLQRLDKDLGPQLDSLRKQLRKQLEERLGESRNGDRSDQPSA